RILRRHPADRMRTAPLHSTIGSARELTELTRNQVSGLTGAVQGTLGWRGHFRMHRVVLSSMASPLGLMSPQA
ncbi:hypothetical protein QMK17_24455, partial [Rhodococcus sp. G-MC3]|uniref:hypothetical protein n=1 Tax=Rhodococcus sp. G-MC3 TaxID=3046209 RepID=UPI0024BB7ABA